MDERLDYIRIEPRRIVDLGCGTGADLDLLGKRYPQALRIGLDWATAHARPFGPSRGIVPADSVAVRAIRCSRAPMQAHFRSRTQARRWCGPISCSIGSPIRSPTFSEMHRVLEVGGMMMFSTLGPDTLKELREALPDSRGDRVHRFIDMHDLGDALVQAGFSDPVMDMEVLTMTYADIDDLLRDLRLSGANNASTMRPRGLSGKNEWRTARQQLEATRVNGRIPITFEIVQGHAWKAPPKTIADGRAVIRFEKRT
jgi:malonyl-CoA O-methyltransferase